MQHVELGVHHSALGCSRCTVTTIGHVDHRMRALSISVCRAGTHACQRLLEAAPAKAWRQNGPVVRNLRTRMRRAREQGRLQRTSGACALQLGATCSLCRAKGRIVCAPGVGQTHVGQKVRISVRPLLDSLNTELRICLSKLQCAS